MRRAMGVPRTWRRSPEPDVSSCQPVDTVEPLVKVPLSLTVLSSAELESSEPTVCPVLSVKARSLRF